MSVSTGTDTAFFLNEALNDIPDWEAVISEVLDEMKEAAEENGE